MVLLSSSPTDDPLREERLDAIVAEFYGLFGSFYRPWIAKAHAALRAGTPGIADADAVADGVCRQLLNGMVHLGVRSLIPAMEEQRRGGARDFRDVAEAIGSDPVREEVLTRLPRLRELLDGTTRRTVALVTEALARFAADRELVASHGLGIGDRITAVELTDGDAHADGRRVLVLRTERGRLVYKPRPLDIDLLVLRLADVVAPTLPRCVLRLPRTLARDGYGWQEFVPARRTTDAREYEAYYRNLGGVLAFFTAFGGHDLHYENVIAHGAHPVVIDLETAIRVRDRFPSGPSLADALTREAAFGPGASLILPNVGNGERFDIDLSAAGTALVQESSVMTSTALTGAGTLDLALTLGPAIIQRTPHAPESLSEAPALEHFTTAMRDGYAEVADAVRRSADELGRILREADGELREILRPTSTYAAFLDASLHPRYLADDGERARLFRLLGAPASVPDEIAERVLDDELRALARHDVPYFVFAPRSATVREACATPLEMGAGNGGVVAVEALAEFARRDPAKDLTLIENLVACTTADVWVRRDADPTRNLFPVGRGDLAEVAHDLLDRAIDVATWSADGRQCTWITPLLDDSDRRVRLAPLDLTLYQGGGLAVVLAASVAATSDLRHADALRAFTETFLEDDVRRPFVEGAQDAAAISAFTGTASVYRTLAAVDQVLDDPRIAEVRDAAAERLARWMVTADAASAPSDYMAGVAGALPLLADADRGSGRFDGARAAGARLLRRALPDDSRHGLAHGRMGGLLGLAAAHTPGDSDVAALADAIGLEVARVAGRSREADREAASWCTGGSGIIVAAVEALGRLGFGVDDIEARVGQTARAFFRAELLGADASLCHGSAGVLAAWARTADALGDRELRQRAAEAGRDMLVRYAAYGYVGGIRHGENTLGYMLGMPGLAHVLLDLSSELPADAAPLRWGSGIHEGARR